MTHLSLENTKALHLKIWNYSEVIQKRNEREKKPHEQEIQVISQMCSPIFIALDWAKTIDLEWGATKEAVLS